MAFTADGCLRRPPLKICLKPKMDQQLPLFSPAALTVSELTRYLRQLMEDDKFLQDIWVYGEISNFKRHTSGHIYLTLKDSEASLHAVIWRNIAERIKLPLQDGMAIEARGYISIYERDGQYQLYINMIRPAGEGRLFQEFLRLKERLAVEGWFDLERKRPLPQRPQKIGIVTSPTGAALQDMLNTLRQRYPLAEVVVAPCLVQGLEAPEDIVRALQDINRLEKPDVIILARGGGSLEDLWAFNDERVVQAVANSPAPEISGVGHETDFTLADFAADQRAPTPTGAAVMATPNKAELIAEIQTLCNRLNHHFEMILENETSNLKAVIHRLARVSPLWKTQNELQRLDQFVWRAERAMQHQLDIRRARWSGIEKQLQTLNPLDVLQRGFAIVSKSDGTLVRSCGDVEIHDELNIRLSDGQISARVTQKG